MTADSLPLINEFIRVVGEQELILHLSGQSSTEEAIKVQTCTKVLLDEWNSRPWTEVSLNGDKLISIFSPQ